MTLAYRRSDGLADWVAGVVFRAATYRVMFGVPMPVAIGVGLVALLVMARRRRRRRS